MKTSGTSFSIWKRVFLWGGVSIAIVLGFFAYGLFRLVNFTIPESYAAWTTGDLVVEYLQTHTNQWPRSWDDLRSATNSRLEKGMSVWMPLDRLPQYVKIDWDVDVGELQKIASSGSNATRRVVTRLDGKRLSTAWGHEPNGVIIAYFQR